MILEDSQLISRVLIYDDRYAFSQLVQKYQSPIRLFLRRMLKGQMEIADELAQETFLVAYKKLSSFRNDAPFIRWLYSIAKNLFLQHLRKSHPHFSLENDDFDESFEKRQNIRMDLEIAMSQLKPIEVASLSMCYYQGMSHTDVAHVLEIPVGTLKTHIHRGKQKLKSILDENSRRPAHEL